MKVERIIVVKGLQKCEELVDGFYAKDFGCDWMLHHSLDELIQLQLFIAVSISTMEHLSDDGGIISLMVFSFSNLDEICHELTEFVQADESAIVSIEEFEHLGEVVDYFAVREHVEKAQHLPSSNRLFIILQFFDE